MSDAERPVADGFGATVERQRWIKTPPAREGRRPTAPPGVVLTVHPGAVDDTVAYFHATFHAPEGTLPGLYRSGTHIARGRNHALREAFAALPRAGWALWVDSDQAFHNTAEVIPRLLAWDQPIVSALVAQRGWPCPLNAFARIDERGFRAGGDRLLYADLPDEGLVKVAGGGPGG